MPNLASSRNNTILATIPNPQIYMICDWRASGVLVAGGAGAASPSPPARRGRRGHVQHHQGLVHGGRVGDRGPCMGTVDECHSREYLCTYIQWSCPSPLLRTPKLGQVPASIYKRTHVRTKKASRPRRKDTEIKDAQLLVVC